MLTASTERMRIDSSGNVKIGTTTNAWSGSNTLVIKEDSGDGGITLVSSSTSNNMNIGFADTETSSFADMRGLITYLHANDAMRFMTANAEAVRIDSSGNLLVGKTTLDYDGTAGLILRGDGLINATRSGGNVTDFNRLSTDGEVVRISKDGTTVGGIASRGGAAASFVAYTGSGNGAGVGGSTNMIIPASETGAAKDAGVNLGSNSTRWKDLYLSGGVYLGGTGSANHLDDYEEGTWVPTVSSAASYGVQTGLYTKIGNLVNIQCQVQFVQSGTVFGSVSGLPFTVATVNYSGITFREWYSTGVTLSGNLTIGALSTSGFWNYANSSTATNGQTYGYGFSISYRT
jgi:hypothetical protein